MPQAQIKPLVCPGHTQYGGGGMHLVTGTDVRAHVRSTPVSKVMMILSNDRPPTALQSVGVLWHRYLFSIAILTRCYRVPTEAECGANVPQPDAMNHFVGGPAFRLHLASVADCYPASWGHLRQFQRIDPPQVCPRDLRHGLHCRWRFHRVGETPVIWKREGCGARGEPEGRYDLGLCVCMCVRDMAYYSPS